DLPFGLGRQASAGPARKRIGLEVTHVTDWLARRDRLQSLQREVAPRAGRAAAPIQRRAPMFALHGSPTLRQPEFGPLVAAVANELLEFAVRRQPVGELMGRQEDPMTRRLVVVRKTIACMADFVQSFVPVDPT